MTGAGAALDGLPDSAPVPEKTGVGADMLGIQEAATQLGVTMRTLRFYEDKGLIAPHRAGTTRIYSKREMGRMQLILRGKRLGFSIREIKEFLDLYDVDPEHHEQIRTLLARIRDRIEELRQQRTAIDQTLEEMLSIERQSLAWLDGSPIKPVKVPDQGSGSE